MTPDEVKAWDDFIRRSNLIKFAENQEMLRRRFESLPKSPEEILAKKNKKPFLTAADLVMLREMKVGLVGRGPSRE